MSRAHDRVVITEVIGGASEQERDVIHVALERMIEAERMAKNSSLWLRSGRAQGRRLGMFDYRDRFTHDDAWRLSVRMPFGGREYPGRLGRGDAR